MTSRDNFLQHIKTIENELKTIKNNPGQENSDLFRTIINLSPIAKMIVKKGVYVYSNPAALSCFGLENEKDILNKPFLETIKPEYHKEITERIKAVGNGQKNSSIVIELIRPDNEEIFIQTISIPIFYKGDNAALIIGRDITNEYLIKKQLIENEKLLEETERLSKIGSYKINLTTGKATWSKGLYDIFNFSYDTVLPDVKSYYQYVHPEDVIKVKNMLTDCIVKNTPFDLKYRIILPGDVEKTVHSKSEVKTYKNGDKFLVGYYRDITEEIKKDKIITESEHNLHLMFDAIQEGIALNEAVYDENGDVVDYKILSANKAFDRNSEYNAKDVVGKLASEAYQMDQSYIKSWWEKNKDVKFPVYTEMYRPIADKWSYISTSGIIDNKFVTAFFDITDKKKKDLLLEESEKKYKKLIENAPIGVFQITEQRFLFANNNVVKVLGFNSFDELKASSIFDFMSNADSERFKLILQSTHIETHQPNQFFQIDLLTKSRTVRKVEMLVSEIQFCPEQCWQCIMNDVTEKVTLENKAKKLSTDALYMERKLRLFSEIETELNSVVSNSDLDVNIFKKIYNVINEERSFDKIWSIFQNNFELVNEGFFKRLLDIAPSLTQQELKHCAFIKMNFETKEIAMMFHVKPSSIQTSRVRLKKKLGLEPNQDLISFIITL